MHYEFPTIEHINDILWAIEGSDEFIVAEKDGYTVINYVVSMSDTFPSTKPAGGTAKDRAKKALLAALRRECRGIIFCGETGKLLRRPFHKFFNVGEREDHLPQRFDMSKPHVILEKLDGSMIVPFMFRGEVRWGTKMGLTDVAAPVEEFVKNSDIGYEAYARDLLELGFVPIFEWCSRKQRIVLDYGSEDQLVLTAVREQATGKYMPLNYYNRGLYNIPEVRAFEPATDMREFLDYVAELKDVEGFVIRFEDGHMAKVKCDWYCQIHRAKDALTQDRNIVEMIFANNIDDLKPHLPVEDRERLEDFERAVIRRVNEVVHSLENTARIYKSRGWTKKDFALSDEAAKMDPLDRSCIFSIWDDPDLVYDTVTRAIKNRLTKNVNYDTLKTGWFDGIRFND